jgi:hypothetical protein
MRYSDFGKARSGKSWGKLRRLCQEDVSGTLRGIHIRRNGWWSMGRTDEVRALSHSSAIHCSCCSIWDLNCVAMIFGQCWSFLLITNDDSEGLTLAEILLWVSPIAPDGSRFRSIVVFSKSPDTSVYDSDYSRYGGAKTREHWARILTCTQVPTCVSALLRIPWYFQAPRSFTACFPVVHVYTI